MVRGECRNYNECRDTLLNLPLENYLSMNVSKVNLEHYKDIFVSLNAVTSEAYQDKSEVYLKVFHPVIKDYDLTNTAIHEAFYFLNFVAQHHSQLYDPQPPPIHPSWKN